jgi:hypothetical protein
MGRLRRYAVRESRFSEAAIVATVRAHRPASSRAHPLTYHLVRAEQACVDFSLKSARLEGIADIGPARTSDDVTLMAILTERVPTVRTPRARGQSAWWKPLAHRMDRRFE